MILRSSLYITPHSPKPVERWQPTTFLQMMLWLSLCLFIHCHASAQDVFAQHADHTGVQFGGGLVAPLPALQRPAAPLVIQLTHPKYHTPALDSLASQLQADLTLMPFGQLGTLAPALAPFHLDKNALALVVTSATGTEAVPIAAPFQLQDVAWAAQQLRKEGYGLRTAAAITYQDIMMRQLAGLPVESQVLDYLATVGTSSWVEPKNWQLMVQHVHDWQSEPMLYLMYHMPTFKAKYGPEAEGKLEQVCLNALLNSMRSVPGTLPYAELCQRMQKVSYEGMPALLALAEVQRHKLQQNWPAHARAAHELFQKHGSKDPLELAEEARTVWRHLHLMERGAQPLSAHKAIRWALGWTTQAKQLAPDNAFVLETHALLLTAQGQKELGKQAAQLAIQEAYKHQQVATEAERLLDR